MIQTNIGLFGPFLSVQTHADHLNAGGTIFHLATIGEYELVDEDPPGPVHLYTWNGENYVLLPMSEAELTKLKLKYSVSVESAVLQIYARPVTLSREYELRLADAQSFRDGNDVGIPGRVLLGFANAKGCTYTEAADWVLAEGAGFKSAELELADLRMKKYDIERAETENDVTTIYNVTMAAIASIAAAIS